MVDYPTVRLAAGPLELTLNPLNGGSISSFEFLAPGVRAQVLRGCNSLDQFVLGMGSFPLVPYVNRIRGGRFTFRGRTVEIANNLPGDASPLHGQGWLGPWTVEAASDRDAVLAFSHSAGEWPWSYEAWQEFALDEDGLSVALTCRNVSDQPMPCGLGQHPYFHCTSETMLDTGVSHAWTVDENVLPIDKVPATGRLDLRSRRVCGQDLDHGFAGWSGSARLSDPAWPFDLELSSGNASFFQLYSPLAGGIFVAEPVTHANAALNAPEEQWEELGMRVLEPNEEMRLDMRLAVIAK